MSIITELNVIHASLLRI